MKRYFRKRYYRRHSTHLLPMLFLIVLLYSSISTAVKSLDLRFVSLLVFICFIAIVSMYEFIKKSTKEDSTDSSCPPCLSQLKELDHFTKHTWIEQVKDFNNLNINQLKYRIRTCSPRNFEILCYELFKSCTDYKDVFLTQETQDGGKDIIATKNDCRKVYIECKRYTNRSSTNENFMIGREICQKLQGAMSGDGIFEGIIITTGNVHKNATEFLTKLHTNTPYRIKILLADDIVNMIQASEDNTKLITLLY